MFNNMRIYFVITEISAIFVSRKEKKKEFMKKLAIVLWCALIIIMSPIGVPGSIAVGIILLIMYIIRIFKEEEELRKWREGDE